MVSNFDCQWFDALVHVELIATVLAIAHKNQCGIFIGKIHVFLSVLQLDHLEDSVKDINENSFENCPQFSFETLL